MDLGSGKKAECTAQNKGKREEMRCNRGNNPARTKWLCYKQKPRDMFKIQHRGSSVCQEDVSEGILCYIHVILVLFRRNLSFLYDYHFSQTDLATCHIFSPLVLFIPLSYENAFTQILAFTSKNLYQNFLSFVNFYLIILVINSFILYSS